MDMWKSKGRRDKSNFFCGQDILCTWCLFELAEKSAMYLTALERTANVSLADSSTGLGMTQFLLGMIQFIIDYIYDPKTKKALRLKGPFFKLVSSFIF